MHLHRVCHDDILRQMRVERIGDAVARDAGGGAEVGDIDARMYACVRAAAAGHMDRMSDDGGSRLLERLADGRDRLLHLPAVIGRAEIFKRQGNVAHRILPYHLRVKRRKVPASKPPPCHAPHDKGELSFSKKMTACQKSPIKIDIAPLRRGGRLCPPGRANRFYGISCEFITFSGPTESSAPITHYTNLLLPSGGRAALLPTALGFGRFLCKAAITGQAAAGRS